MNGRKNAESSDLRGARRSFSRAGLGFTVFFLVAAVSELAVSALLGWYGGRIGDRAFQALVLLSMYPLAFPAACLVIRTLPAKGPTRTCPMGGLRFLGVFVICVGAMFAGNLIGQILMWIAGLLRGNPVTNDMERVLENMDMGAVILIPVLLAPVVEETLFRKLLIDRVAPYGQGLAILASGLLFGLAHGNFYQFFYAFALGAIFAYVYLHTGRVRYTIALHMLVNFSGSVLPLLFLRIMDSHRVLGSALIAGDMLLLISSAGVGVILLFVFRRQIFFERMKRQLPVRQWFRALFLNPGVILFLIYCLISFAFL